MKIQIEEKEITSTPFNLDNVPFVSEFVENISHPLHT